MKWDIYHTKEIKEEFIYRYLTLEKLIDFLETGELYLTRLDHFEDNLENITPFDINEIRVQSKFINFPEKANPNISVNEWNSSIKKSRFELKRIKDNLQEQQRHRFVSCWILNNVESFGMWDIYGKSGFAIRFKRKYFQNIIKDSRSIQTEPTNMIDLIVAGKVEYQSFDEMLEKEEEAKLKYSVFRKHLSFNHESEYRIVGFVKKNIDCKGLRYKLPDLKTLEFDLIANPRLDSFQFDKYKSILNKYCENNILKESSLKTWLEFRKIEY